MPLILVLAKQAACAKPPPVCADSRFAKPRNSLQGRRFYVLFASAKRTKKQTGFHPATPVQIAGRYDVLDRFSGFHQVTGYEQTTISLSIDGNDLNRCELQA